MKTILEICKTNPVRVMAILNTFIVLIVSFGAHLTTQQIAAITGFAGVVLGLGGELVRSNVTPMATLPDHIAAAVNAEANASIAKTGSFPVGTIQLKVALAVLTAGLAISACGAHVKTGVSPVADIANAGGKIEESGQAIFQAVIKATPYPVSQQAADNVAIAVNKLGHAGVTLNNALTTYNLAKAAQTDLSLAREAVQSALRVVSDFLIEIGKALPPGILKSVDLLVTAIINIVALVKQGVGL